MCNLKRDYNHGKFQYLRSGTTSAQLNKILYEVLTYIQIGLIICIAIICIVIYILFNKNNSNILIDYDIDITADQIIIKQSVSDNIKYIILKKNDINMITINLNMLSLRIKSNNINIYLKFNNKDTMEYFYNKLIIELKNIYSED